MVDAPTVFGSVVVGLIIGTILYIIVMMGLWFAGYKVGWQVWMSLVIAMAMLFYLFIQQENNP